LGHGVQIAFMYVYIYIEIKYKIKTMWHKLTANNILANNILTGAF